LIGAVAAWLAFRLTTWFAGCLLSNEAGDPAVSQDSFIR
jgi:hypothetical protein